eukprot:190784_1
MTQRGSTDLFGWINNEILPKKGGVKDANTPKQKSKPMKEMVQNQYGSFGGSVFNIDLSPPIKQNMNANAVASSTNTTNTSQTMDLNYLFNASDNQKNTDKSSDSFYFTDSFADNTKKNTKHGG